ncbi:hypothetical protein ABPG74_004021 [Tetrahymena malaccensis]
MSSSACERFVFDVCSANPNICKTCKNNKAMHTDCAPVKKDFKFGVQVKTNQTLNQQNQLPSKIEKKTPLNQKDDKIQESQESSNQKISQQPAPSIVTSAKPNDIPKSPLELRNEVVQQPTSQEIDLSRNNQVQQLIREKEDKIKQNIINQYVSTPKRGSQTSNTPSQRPSVASACQSICSVDSPTSQKSLPSSNFSNAAQKLQDQQDTKQQQQQDENSNQFPSSEQAKINENLQNELTKNTHDQANKINIEKNNPSTQNYMVNQDQQSAEQQNQKQVQQDLLDLKLKQERERQEQQKIEKEKLAAQLQKQSQEKKLCNEEKSKPIQQNKGLTLAEILAKQKQKIEQEGEKIIVGQQQNQISQNTKPNLPQTINNGYNSIQKQPVLKEEPQKSIQQKSDQVNNQTSQQEQVNTERKVISNQNVIDNLQKKNVNQDDSQKNNKNDILKLEEKKEQKPLSTVAQRIQELQKQQQQQQLQHNQIHSNQKFNLYQKVGQNAQFDNQKIEAQKEQQPKIEVVNQVKLEKAPEITAQQTEKSDETVDKQTKQEQDQIVAQEIKKPSSLIQQLQNQIGNLNFGVQPKICQNKQQTNQHEDAQQNDLLNIPFLKEQSSDQRELEKDFLDRPVMKKNVRSSRKMNLNELKDEKE